MILLCTQQIIFVEIKCLKLTMPIKKKRVNMDLCHVLQHPTNITSGNTRNWVHTLLPCGESYQGLHYATTPVNQETIGLAKHAKWAQGLTKTDIQLYVYMVRVKVVQIPKLDWKHFQIRLLWLLTLLTIRKVSVLQNWFVFHSELTKILMFTQSQFQKNNTFFLV